MNIIGITVVIIVGVILGVIGSGRQISIYLEKAPLTDSWELKGFFLQLAGVALIVAGMLSLLTMIIEGQIIAAVAAMLLGIAIFLVGFGTVIYAKKK